MLLLCDISHAGKNAGAQEVEGSGSISEFKCQKNTKKYKKAALPLLIPFVKNQVHFSVKKSERPLLRERDHKNQPKKICPHLPRGL